LPFGTGGGGAVPLTVNAARGGGGGAGAGGGGGGAFDTTTDTDTCGCDAFLVGLLASPALRQFGQVNFWKDCWRSKRFASLVLSMTVAPCTNRLVVDQISSLSGSFESIVRRCCNMLRNCTSCGLSATWRRNQRNTLFFTLK